MAQWLKAPGLAIVMTGCWFYTSNQNMNAFNICVSFAELRNDVTNCVINCLSSGWYPYDIPATRKADRQTSSDPGYPANPHGSPPSISSSNSSYHTNHNHTKSYITNYIVGERLKVLWLVSPFRCYGAVTCFEGKMFQTQELPAEDIASRDIGFIILGTFIIVIIIYTVINVMKRSQSCRRRLQSSEVDDSYFYIQPTRIIDHNYQGRNVIRQTILSCPGASQSSERTNLTLFLPANQEHANHRTAPDCLQTDGNNIIITPPPYDVSHDQNDKPPPYQESVDNDRLTLQYQNTDINNNNTEIINNINKICNNNNNNDNEVNNNNNNNNHSNNNNKVTK
ncbi:hypothetical protein HELRODRAFT_190152 [Helobdella robusta]|uniref:Uncharacterized protein n=1 Tax=Helobdella robusta TaxID=6412 RepID=T1FRQ9_HELRO|nr:hypothetical protein HELRODRAFT_190152 [Helobdella robusta]ESO10738.1 hypothetical protein HELRODRAFT_190152 [Helobdella robusta]